MKIKLFTHTDLDGVGCAIIGKLAFGTKDIDITYCDYNDVNEKVEEFYVGSNKNQYDRVFITDISVNKDVAEIIEYYKDSSIYPKIQLLDHHPTALDLNEYGWANVIIEDDKEKVSGTYLFYTYLTDKGYLSRHIKSDLFRFIEKVKRYDTWLWKTKYNDIEAKQLNDLLYIYGRDIFVEKFLDFLFEGDWYAHETFINDESKLLLQLEENKINRYIDSKSKELIAKHIEINNKTYKVGIVFAEQYLSELGNVLAEQNKYLDFIAIVTNMNTISYRSIGDKVDLGKDIASFYNGGGHPNAAGSRISEEIKHQIINFIFNK